MNVGLRPGLSAPGAGLMRRLPGSPGRLCRVRNGRGGRHRRAIQPGSSAGRRDRRPRHQRSDLRAAGRISGRAARRSIRHRYRPGPGRAVGTDRLAELALPPAARVPAGTTGSRSPPRTWSSRSMPSAIRPSTRRPGRTSPARSGRRRRTPRPSGSPSPSRRPSSCMTPPITCGSCPVTSGTRSRGIAGRPTPRLAHLVGSGPYRVQDWERGRFLTLVADTSAGAAQRRPAIRRAVWRFAPDPDAALNLVLEPRGRPDGDGGSAGPGPARARGTPAFRTDDRTRPRCMASWPSGWPTHAGRPHPVLGDRELRRALTAGRGSAHPGPRALR